MADQKNQFGEIQIRFREGEGTFDFTAFQEEEQRRRMAA